MKVIVFGATGTTGSEVVAQALEQGRIVTAFVRNPAKVVQTHPNLKITQGDVLNPADVVAEFMLKQLTDDTYIRATPGLSN